jgi:tRNA-splicing ligase RtcB
MDPNRLLRKSEVEWWLSPSGRMRVPGIIFASEDLVRAMDEKVLEQVRNVATLPGIVRASFAMPDAHWGYGFPIGGVAGFAADEGGVISAGGVGFDISCGVRTLLTGLSIDEIQPRLSGIADALFRAVPCGVGSSGPVRLSNAEMDDMMLTGAAWSVKKGFGAKADLEVTEENGTMAGADPDAVSREAKERQRDQLGTLGSGNHYLEVQEIVEVFSPEIAQAYRLRPGDVVVSIH